MLLERGTKKSILLVPGNGFTTRPELPCQYMRASYSTVLPEEMDKVCVLRRTLVCLPFSRFPLKMSISYVYIAISLETKNV